MTCGGREIPIIFCVIVLLNFANCINVDFYDTKDGFFLKSTYHKFKASEPTIVKEALILTHPAEVYKLRASYGPIETYQSVPNDVLSSVVQYGEDVWDKSESSMHRQVVHNMDVSAHLVGESGIIRQSNPKLQLLVHARPLSRHHIQERIFSYYNVTQVWCARLFVSRGKEQYTSACILNKDTNACVVGMTLPSIWWDVDEKLAKASASGSTPQTVGEDVLVFYDLSRMEGNQECASVSNIIAPAQGPPDNSEKKFITAVKLVQDNQGLKKYSERRSQNLTFHIPVADLAAGEKIEVPVYLEPHSSLKSFFVQVQVRGNIAIEGASTDLNSPWMVFFEAGDKDSVATVTAMLKDDHEPSQQDKAEEIMRWQFRVPLGSGALSTARVMWIVDYDKHGLSRNAFYFPEGFKVTAKFLVLPDRSVQIIPVLKERSLLNTAILSGEILRYELNIFSVSQDNTFRDVTKDSFCRSLNPQVVKVSTLCSEVYLDGSETHGSKNVTIVTRSGDHTAELSVRVWVPEPNLDIQLSDYRLSQVRRWKVPQKSYLKSRYLRSADPAGRDTLSMWNSTIVRGSKRTNPSKSCVLKYQQSQIEVYARFIISSPGEGIEYFRSKKTFMLVTDLVMKHLRTENSNIARIYHNTLQGVSPGVTSVQVISPTGEILGSKEVRVGKDKVDLERLMVRVISAMRIRIDKIENVPGALLATVSLQDQLVAKQQEAILDIALEFKDGTVLPLSSIDPEDYDLRVSSVNNDIVEVNELKASLTYKPPSIKAIGDGKGEIIKVTLKEPKTCERKKPRYLDAEYVHVQVDFAKEIFSNLVQSDSHYTGNHDHWNQNKNAYFAEQEKLNNESKFPKVEPKMHPVDAQSDEVTDSDEDSGITREPKTEALEQPVSTKAKHPSPLEVAMYVLVAVFVFAILVFTANCAVFMMRHQRKCKPYSKGMASKVVTGSISQAPDWVWIGRATLERQGAGNAGVDHALMAEEDFNGNQMVLPNLTTGSASSKHSSTRKLNSMSRSGSSSSSSGCPTTSASSGSGGSNRNSMVSTYQGSECSIRITSNPLPEDIANNDLGGMGYNEAEWDYEAMGMTYEQLMEYFDNLKESSA